MERSRALEVWFDEPGDYTPQDVSRRFEAYHLRVAEGGTLLGRIDVRVPLAWEHRVRWDSLSREQKRARVLHLAQAYLSTFLPPDAETKPVVLTMETPNPTAAIERLPDRCGGCGFDDLPPQHGPCPKCGKIGRVLDGRGLIGGFLGRTGVAPIVDQVVVRSLAPQGASERTRLLARIEALTKTIRAIAADVVEKDEQLFIGALRSLERAIGLAQGTQDDLLDGRVLDA